MCARIININTVCILGNNIADAPFPQQQIFNSLSKSCVHKWFSIKSSQSVWASDVGQTPSNKNKANERFIDHNIFWQEHGTINLNIYINVLKWFTLLWIPSRGSSMLQILSCSSKARDGEWRMWSRHKSCYNGFFPNIPLPFAIDSGWPTRKWLNSMCIGSNWIYTLNLLCHRNISTIFIVVGDDNANLSDNTKSLTLNKILRRFMDWPIPVLSGIKERCVVQKFPHLLNQFITHS